MKLMLIKLYLKDALHSPLSYFTTYIRNGNLPFIQFRRKISDNFTTREKNLGNSMFNLNYNEVMDLRFKATSNP